MNQAFLKDMALDVQYRRVKSSKGSRKQAQTQMTKLGKLQKKSHKANI